MHKAGDDTVLRLAIAMLLTGQWQANAPRWMRLALIDRWRGLLGTARIVGRSRRRAPTCKAIRGPDDLHPGNRGSGHQRGAGAPSRTTRLGRAKGSLETILYGDVRRSRRRRIC